VVDSITVSKQQQEVAKATKVWVGQQVETSAGTTKLSGGVSTLMAAAEANATLPVPRQMVVPVGK
jgi:hypothetical protein